MLPESSDGFASVGTILPREEGCPVAGWPFHFSSQVAILREPFFTPVPERLDTIRKATYKRGRADVAQLVEQLIRNQQVNGSSPFVGSSVLWDLACKGPSGWMGLCRSPVCRNGAFWRRLRGVSLRFEPTFRCWCAGPAGGTRVQWPRACPGAHEPRHGRSQGTHPAGVPRGHRLR